MVLVSIAGLYIKAIQNIDLIQIERIKKQTRRGNSLLPQACPFLAMSQDSLQCVIVAFHGHTHLLLSEQLYCN